MSAEPFKGLARFEDTDDDAALFFGRERDREIIAANLMASRLTVLYGESGVGKSSLLRAGVAHRLRRSPEPLIVVVFDAWQSDPVGALGRALADAAGIEPAPTLADTLEACAAVIDGDVYVLLDQVDEYFLYHGHQDGPGTFAEQFPDAVGRSGLRASFLVALREETLAKLDTFKARIPNLFGNYLRLEHLDRAAGRAAILGPVEQVNRSAPPDEGVEIEPELVDAVLDQVTAGKLDLAQAGRGVVDNGARADDRIETPYLQLVMQRLWAEEREAGSRTLRVGTLRALGGAEQIVRDQLRGALDALSPDQQDVAAAVFNHLVTPSGTKIAHAVGDLAEYAHVDETELAPVLSRLADERILRPVADPAGGQRYEIYHDVLADAALAWKRAHDVDRELAGQREQATRRHRRLVVALVAAALLLAVMAGVTVFALAQRSDARTQARRAHARELDATAVTQMASAPTKSLRQAVEAVQLAPSAQAESVLRHALLAARERAVFHARGPVTAVRYSPHGTRMLTASEDGRARIYDLRTRRLVATTPAGAPIRDAHFAAAGRLVLTGGDDGAVKIWNADNGRLVRSLRLGVPVHALAVDDKQGLVVGVGGREARLWRIGNGALLERFRSPRPLTGAAFSPDGRLVAVAGLDPRARVYETSTGALVHRFDQGASVTSVAFSPGGKLLITAGKNGTATIWNVEKGTKTRDLRGAGNVLDAAFSPRGTLVATVSSDGTGQIWRAATGALVSSLIGHTNHVSSVAFSPNGFSVVTTSSDRTARVWKVENGDALAVLAGHSDSVRDASFSPNGKTVLTASDDGTARLWDPEAQPMMPVLTRGPGPVAYAGYVRDGVVLVAGASGSRLVRATDGRTIRSLDNRAASAAAVSPGGSRLAVGSGRKVRIYDARSGSTVATLPQPTAVKGVALSPDGERVAVAGVDGVGRIWTVGGTLEHELRGHSAPLTDIAFSPDGARVATGSRDKTARVWNADTGALEHVLQGHRDAVTSVAFSPDGRLIVTASRDGDGRLWDAATGDPVQLLRWHFGSVADAEFSPDGRWIVTAGPATAQLWQPGVDEPLLPFGLGGHTRPLTSAGFDPSSRTVLTAGLDGTVRRYRCAICGGLDELLGIARTRLAQTAPSS